ncbi:MAG: hypothetical protein AB7G37_00975 [Solirubrobacteraceae bacterium]
MSTHLRYPLAITRRPDGTASYAEVEQGSDEEIRRGIALLCDLRPGDLPWDDDLGIPDPLGSTSPTEAGAVIDQAIRQVETRRDITVDVTDTPVGRVLRPRITA